MSTSPIWGAFVWSFYEATIRPRRIPAQEIEAEARALMSRRGKKASEYAFMEEDRAWRYSKTLEQGRWRRVRLTIQRLQSEE